MSLKAPIVSLRKKLYSHRLVLGNGSRNGIEHDFTIKLKQIESLMEDLLKWRLVE